MGWFSWDLVIAIVWAAFAFVVWIDPRDEMPKSLTITLMLILFFNHFFDAMERAFA